MRWSLWSQILIALCARTLAQSNTPTMCEEEACRCDSFTRVICNCTNGYNEITLRPDGAYRIPTMATGIIVNGCERVQFLPETIRNLIHLQSVEIRNAGDVVVREHALSWSPFNVDAENNPGIRIIIFNSTIKEISSYAVQGRVDNILISNSILNSIKPFAFSSLTGVANIELLDNEFQNIEIQAFKKFSTSNFILRGGNMRTVPSRFLSDVEITNLFRMEGVNVYYLYSLAFLVTSPQRVRVESNTIGIMEGDGFHIETRGSITFRNNTLRTIRKGAFYGFTVNPSVLSLMGPQELLIDNSTVTDLIPSSLQYNQRALTLRVDGMNLNMSCTCELAEAWKEMLKDQGSAINCWYDLDNHFISLSTFVVSRCGTFKQTFWIFVVVGILVVLALAGVIIFYIVMRENEKNKKVQIVMPDGKTYRETEFHIVVERAELLTTDL